MQTILAADYQRHTGLTALYLLAHADGTTQVRCPDCDAWCALDGRLRHGKRCDLSHLQPTSPQTPPAPARDLGTENTKRANGLTGEELLSKVQLGYLTMSEAMNTDF